ncbi:MAG TPA: peptidylprolyl isomerase [Candidatus Limnocylindrales bacterium]|nr:peptidylprolyl isomerase [Candidatus Limnocylindrales bacterium]
MTLRARPVARRRGRAGWDPGDRRNSLINLGFFLAIGFSILILIGYAAWSWYDDHYGSAAVVNGQVITKDDLRARLKIETFRLDYVASRIQTLMASRQITPDDGAQQLSFIEQRRQQLPSLTLERLIDVSLMTKLAADNGVQITDADVDAQLLQEATTAEQRHTWMIEIDPVTDPDTGEATADQKRAALIRAQQALGRLSRGESWDDVAKTASDSALAPQAGDLGFVAKDSGYDAKFMDAIFSATINQPTGIVEGSDGNYYIGRYTEDEPESVDPDFQSAITAAGINIPDYRTAVRGDVLRKKLSDKITADLEQPSPQRHVLQIRLPEPDTSQLQTETGTKVRWIVFAPKDNMANAPDVPADDPSWAKAKADADEFAAMLKVNPAKFDELARSSSDESTGKSNGGKQAWIYPSSTIDATIKNAIVSNNDEDGTILAPVKGEAGWYLIQIMRRTTDGEDVFLEGLKAKATDDASFKQLARDNSEGDGAKDAGDIGWIVRGQLASDLDTAVFDTAIGSTSDVITVSGDGVYLFRILAEETRPLTEKQLAIIKDSGFTNWYTREKDKAKIDRPLSSSVTG